MRGSSECRFRGVNISAMQKSRFTTPAKAGHNQMPTVLLLRAPAVALCRAHASSPQRCPPFGPWGSARDARKKKWAGAGKACTVSNATKDKSAPVLPL